MASINFSSTVLKPVSSTGARAPSLRRRASAPELAHLDGIYQNIEPGNEAGNVLRLQLTDCTVQAKIMKAFTPFTMAQAMVVRIFEPAVCLEGDFVLKVYDRRYIPDIREEWREGKQAGVWDRARDMQLEKGRWSKDFAEHFLDLMANDHLFYVGPDDEDEQDEQDDTEQDALYKEVFFEALCLKMYRAELEVYRRMREHRQDGINVPRLISSVRIPDVYHSKHLRSKSASVLGILMQYIPGFSLIDLYNTQSPLPAQKDWKAVADDGLSVVQYYSKNMEMLNTDENIARNTLVHWDPITNRWKCKLIDFGHCQFRKAEERQWGWRRRQAGHDEEAMIAGRMGVFLRKRKGYGYAWERSQYSEDLMRDFNGEFSTGIEPGV